MPEHRADPLAFARRRLEALRGRHLYRATAAIARGDEPWIELDGRRLLNLSSNNYLGLASHPAVKQAAAAAAEQQGCGAGASRLIAGTSALHEELEARLARFKGAESALLFTSGYTANLGAISALVGPGDVVLGDELNHASLIDGCRLSRAEFITYPHRDIGALAVRLREARQRRPQARVLVVTDAVFSMDGDLAPLDDLAELCSREAVLLYVDEAHATGCLGPGGRGLVASRGLENHVTVTMGTLSKALGSFGAFVTGERLLRDYLVNVCRTFIFTTALPPPVVAASLAALSVLEREPWRIDRLQENARFLREGLRDRGFDTLDSQTHIVPVRIGDSATAQAMAAVLREAGIFAVAIRPPTVPQGQARLRISVMATHAVEELAWALDVIEQAGRRLGLARGGGAARQTNGRC